MRWGRIPDGDSLFRHAVFPTAFKSNKSFAPNKAIKLETQKDGSLLASLTWDRYVPSAEYIHDYGCRLVSRRNTRALAKGKLKDRSVYCGAYELRARNVRELPTSENLDELLSADVIHHVEDGEIAHTNLRIILRPGTAVSPESTKTAIIDRLWALSRGPLKHSCDCDKDIDPHPSSGLPVGPNGPYLDSRSSLLRRWCVVRFQIFNWIWRNSIRTASMLPHTRPLPWPLIRFHICNRLWRFISED
jgi:hypothetical protein